MKRFIAKNLGIWTAVALYIASLCLPGLIEKLQSSSDRLRIQCSTNCALEIENCVKEAISNSPVDKVFVVQILLFGWFGFFIGNFAWFGNVLFLVAIVLALRSKYCGGAICSVIGLLLGLQALMLTSYPGDEGGVTEEYIQYFGIGYYLWVLSFAILFAYCLFSELRKVSLASETPA